MAWYAIHWFSPRKELWLLRKERTTFQTIFPSLPCDVVQSPQHEPLQNVQHNLEKNGNRQLLSLVVNGRNLDPMQERWVVCLMPTRHPRNPNRF
eukprot:472198-Amorphochlora_amoeboformis.AAC.1